VVYHRKKWNQQLYEDNSACISHLTERYIKGDRTKHILPKFFFIMIFKEMVI